MTTGSIGRLTLRDERDVDKLLGRLASGESATLVVEVPRESTVLLTASEYRRIRAALNETEADFSLELDPDDHFRQNMARMLGVPVIKRSDGVDDGSYQRRPVKSEGSPRPGAPSPGDQATADLASYAPSPRAQRPVVRGPSRRSPTGTIVLVREDVPTGTADGVGRGQRWESGFSGTLEEAITTARAARLRPGERPRSERSLLLRVLLVTCLLLFAAATAATLVLLLAPRATVTLVPETMPLRVELTYGLDSSGQTLDLAIPARPIERTINVELSRPTTGERFEPDGTASGQVVLVNPFPRSVTIPGGTTLTGSNGVSYTTLSEVTVPAADPFGSLSFGSATVGIQAAIAGPDGNADPGVVTGQLDNGVFYNNQQPISGGTLKRIPLVAEGDLNALREQAKTELQGKVDQTVQEALEPGERLLEGSIEVGEPNYQFSHQVGDAADQVTVRASLTVRARAYNPDAIHQQAQDEAGRRLARLAGPQVVLLGNTLEFTEPEAIGSSGTAWRIAAAGQARIVLTEEQLAAAQEAVAGKSLAEAEAALRRIDGVADARIALQPDWVPRRMPEFASQIQVVVQSE
uniref:Baseplate protein J-like barrel domain-containing protein n=1 Tax=Thermorudis peleae TaxID=1382356 RepID=A0A831X954_9BACT